MIKPQGLYVSSQNLENHCNVTTFIIGFGDIWFAISRMYVRSSRINPLHDRIEILYRD